MLAHSTIEVGFPTLSRRSLGVGLDLPWGKVSGFAGDPGRPARVSERVVRFLRAHAHAFSHLFVSFQPNSRNHLALEDYAPAFDDLFSRLPAYQTRALHQTLFNLGALEAYDRAPVVDFTNALIERYNLSWVNEDLGIWSLNGRTLPYPLPPCLTEEALEQAILATSEVVRSLSVPLLVEFPGFSSGACLTLGSIHAYDFFKRVVEESGAAATLDTGHLLSYQWARGRRGQDLLAQLDRLPLERCYEVHLSGAEIVGQRFIDTHDGVLLDEQLALLECLLESCPNLRAVTYEDPRFDASGQLASATRSSLALLCDRVAGWVEPCD